MGLLSRLAQAGIDIYNDVAYELTNRNTSQSYDNPNAQPSVTPASRPMPVAQPSSAASGFSYPASPPSTSGVVRPFPGGAQFVSITLSNPGGNGTAQIGPQRVKEHWQITGVGVAVSTQMTQAQCSVYIGSTASAATFLGSTQNGSSGDTCAVANMDIQPGQYVFAVWSNGDAGSTATMTVFGTYSIGAP